MSLSAGTPEHVTAYVAAYALGLAFTRRRDRELVRELIESADGDVAVLEAARAHIRRTDVADPRARHRALALVRRARRALGGKRADPRPRHGPSGPGRRPERPARERGAPPTDD